MTEIKHDLDHEVYIEADGKEHVNHGMLEYTEEDLKTSHALYDKYHEGEEIDSNDGKINDYHTRHQDKNLEVYCDNHPDSLECRVYDD